MSLSFGGQEFSGETGMDSHLNHPGVAITVATGLVLGNERDQQDTNCEEIGTILNQTPGAGTPVLPGTAVSYTLAVKPSGRFRCN